MAEVHEVLGVGAAKKPTREFDCAVRTRLGALSPNRTDLWWRTELSDVVIADVTTRLVRDAIPFFARLGTRETLLRELPETFAPCEPWSWPPGALRAIMLVRRGDTSDARALLAEHAMSAESPRAAAYARSIAARLHVALDQ